MKSTANSSNTTPHNPVMLKEMLKYLAPKNNEHFLDCTFGAGGYSKAILGSCDCNITALDQDKMVKHYADELKNNYKDKFNFILTNFAEIPKALCGFDGIVLDLGVSSMQLDTAERGFSFNGEGKLDMRMAGSGMTAADFINTAGQEELAEIIWRYGDESASRRIAKAVVIERQVNPITTTTQFASIVRRAVGFRPGKIDSATKTFQAIRIHINDELKNLERFLDITPEILSPRGRLVIVSFHSLEDQIVKNFFKNWSAKPVARSKYAKSLPETDAGKWLKILTKKPLTPSVEEIRLNSRARSAKLRAAIRIGESHDAV